MRALAHDFAGIVHLATALLALALGSMVLARTKGTLVHRVTGYFYLGSMLLMNCTALVIYRLFDGWGPFHYAAVLSLATLVMGFLPAFFRVKNWLQWHVAGMYFSVIGLYAAFLSEILTRIPGANFPAMVGIGTAIVMAGGVIGYVKFRNSWLRYSRTATDSSPGPPNTKHPGT